MLGNELKISGDEKVRFSAEVFVNSVKTIEVKEGLENWEVLKRSPSYILYSLSRYFGKKELFGLFEEYFCKPLDREMASGAEYVGQLLSGCSLERSYRNFFEKVFDTA